MADDGILLNFELGDGLLKPQIKFTGGRWRDRVRAERSAKRRRNGDTTDDNSTTDKPSTSQQDGKTAEDDGGRPAKRWKAGIGTARETSKSNGTLGRTPPSNTLRRSISKSHGVTSRLFTSNPTPTTVFEAPREEPTDVAKPSNAPLSEEAANFHALGLSRRLAQHLSTKLEMKAPTSIQKNTIPQLVKNDSDAFLQAETGSGKTLAYLLPIIQRITALSQNEDGTPKDVRIHRNSGLFAIILAPTRELCKQISVVAEKLLRCTPWIVSTTVIGGESKKSEKARIRKGVNILIATPGRLTDHLDHTEVLDVGTARWLVLDEGDRLMEMGFEADIRTIVAKIRKQELKRENKDGVVLGGPMPSRRVTVLCSATMKMNVQKLGEISLQDAVHITAAADDGTATKDEAGDAVFAAPSQLKQAYIIAPAKLRLVTLIALLKSSFARKGSVMKAIVFISCADSVDFHFDLLKAAAETEDGSGGTSSTKGQPPSLTATTVAVASYITSQANSKITLCRLHGSLPQPVRTSTLASFTTATDPAILITTDISSRGLDVPAVDLVIEYDPAFSVADHVHRIGRTARAGRPGKALLFLLPGCEEGYVSLLSPSSSSALTPQSYDTILQQGLSSPVDLPKPKPGTTNDDDTASQGEKKSWKSRAESLQLHFERRLLIPDQVDAAVEAKHRGYPKVKDSKLLDAARRAFRSHIRAYATHVRDERGFFDITQLHLGHTAKSFGLREAPGGIGGGVQRRTHRPSNSGHGAGGGGGKGRGQDSDDEADGSKAKSEEEAARRMREKMKTVMSASSEFNIG